MALSFDGINKIVTITSDTELDVMRLWSRWVDWWVTSDNSKYELAMEQVGGNDIDLTAGTEIPIYIFLVNGWVIRPQEANHTLNVINGILVVDGGGDPFINPIGAFTIRINYQQPVQALTVATGGGGGLTAAQVWAYGIETGLSALQAMKLITAVLSGKTTIIDLGGGIATVTFRDVNDTVDRVVANMTGSERFNVTKNL